MAAMCVIRLERACFAIDNLFHLQTSTPTARRPPTESAMPFAPARTPFSSRSMFPLSASEKLTLVYYLLLARTRPRRMEDLLRRPPHFWTVSSARFARLSTSSIEADVPLSSSTIANLTWADIKWVQSLAPGLPVLVKGVQSPEDVELAQKHGAAGVIISNHGVRRSLKLNSTTTDSPYFSHHRAVNSMAPLLPSPPSSVRMRSSRTFSKMMDSRFTLTAESAGVPSKPHPF